MIGPDRRDVDEPMARQHERRLRIASPIGAGALAINRYGGREKVQFRVLDAAPAER